MRHARDTAYSLRTGSSKSPRLAALALARQNAYAWHNAPLRPPRHLLAEPGGDLGGGSVRGGAPLSSEPAARSGGAPAAAAGLPSSFGRFAPGESSPSSRSLAEGERRGAAAGAAEGAAAGGAGGRDGVGWDGPRGGGAAGSQHVLRDRERGSTSPKTSASGPDALVFESFTLYGENGLLLSYQAQGEGRPRRSPQRREEKSKSLPKRGNGQRLSGC